MTAQLTEVTQTTTTEPAATTTAEAAVSTSHGPFHRFVTAIREMNHASRRLVEVQAPWAVDAQWHNK